MTRAWSIVASVLRAPGIGKAGDSADIMRALRFKSLEQSPEALGLAVRDGEAFTVIMDIASPCK